MSKLLSLLAISAIVVATLATVVKSEFNWGVSHYPYPSDEELNKEFLATVTGLNPGETRSHCPNKLDEIVQACFYKRNCNRILLEKAKVFDRAHQTDIINEDERLQCD